MASPASRVQLTFQQVRPDNLFREKHQPAGYIPQVCGICNKKLDPRANLDPTKSIFERNVGHITGKQNMPHFFHAFCLGTYLEKKNESCKMCNHTITYVAGLTREKFLARFVQCRNELYAGFASF